MAPVPTPAATSKRPDWCAGVPEPSVLEMNWKEAESFTAADDPDRMAYPWQPPAFVPERLREIDAGVAEPRSIRRVDIDLGMGKGSHAYMLHNVLSEDECRALIDACNTKQFTPALVNVGGGRQQYIPDYRKGLRCVVDNADIARLIYTRIAPYTTPLGMWEEVGLNERLRVLCYHKAGELFQRHCDGMFCRPGTDERSLVTTQIYLNTIPDAARNGGGTLVCTRRGDLIAEPRAGSILCFTQMDVEHEGMELFTGGLKYTLRTELMYKRKESA